MKLTCWQKNLLKGISVVGRAISRNSSLPILENILLETEKGRLKFNATNLEIAITTFSGAKIEYPGKITIPHKIIHNFVSSIPNKKINLITKGDSLLITSENFKTRIIGLSAKDFPLIPRVEKKQLFKISAPILKRALSQVISSAAISESRPEINGIFLAIAGEEARLVATDSYRLAEKKIVLRERIGINVSAIIPLKTAQELTRLLTEQEGEVLVLIDESQIMFTLGDTELVSRLVSGVFPDYQRIIPEIFSTEAIINSGEFVNSVKTTGLFSGRVADMSLEFTLDGLEIKASSAEVGSQEYQLSAKIKSGGKGKVILNHQYLLGGLENILTEQVAFFMNDSQTPVLLKPYSESVRPKDRNFIYLLMPIKN